MTTKIKEADDRVLHARTGWMSRFVAGGVPIADFVEVTNSVARWEDWCAAWSDRG